MNAPEAGASLAAMLPITLLHIEDDALNQEVVTAILDAARPRWRVLVAGDGKTGLEMARQVIPDLILLDLHLPELRGEAVLAEIRGDPSTRHIPVVILSGDMTSPLGDMLRSQGASDCIGKPFDVVDLLARLDRLLLKAARS